MKPIYLHNDWLEIVGPIRGRDPLTGHTALYHSTEVTGWITADSGSTVPLGSLDIVCPEIGQTGQYSVAFDAVAIDAALGALADGTIVYRIVSGPGDLRVEDALEVTKTRPSD